MAFAMNTSRDLLHPEYTSARRVRRGGPSDLVLFGGAARTYQISSPGHQPSGARARKVIMSPRRSFSTARSWHVRAGDTPDCSHMNIKAYPRLPVSKGLVPSVHTAVVPVPPWPPSPHGRHQSVTTNFCISGSLQLVTPNRTPSPAPRVEKQEVGIRAHINPGLNYTRPYAPYGPLTSPCQTQNGKEPESMNNKQHMSESHPTAYANQ